MSGLVKRSFSLAGHRTSVALEPAFWEALLEIAAERRQSLASLVAQTDAQRGDGHPLASALRLLALRQARAAPDHDKLRLDQDRRATMA